MEGEEVGEPVVGIGFVMHQCSSMQTDSWEKGGDIWHSDLRTNRTV